MQPIQFLRWCAPAALALLAGCGDTPPAARQALPAPETAPDSFRVKFETTKGDLVVQVRKAWAPEGAERFHQLVKRGFYDDARFFRVVKGFVVQFGISGDPKAQAEWRYAMLPDDPVKESNRKGTITYAMAGPRSRTTQVFINLADNTRLDQSGFAPFGQVVEGMDVVERFYSGYGDFPPRGSGPDAQQIETRGNAYLEQRFPRLDYIIKARILPAGQ
ncbi:MAG: peptidylprolyl isomerase [Acidobacteria bacterium]|nr:peptidylprolyl isomerase [Acidobacteriota bacterium]